MDMDIHYMTENDAVRAGNWLNYRIRQKSGNDALSFPVEILPKNGLSCFAGKRLLAAAFLYLEKSSPIAVCGWCVANPENKPSESAAAVKEILKSMPEYAHSQGASVLLTTFGNRGINRIARSIGFIPGEKAENMFMKLSE